MQVLEYDRIEVSQEIDTNKTDTNKKKWFITVVSNNKSEGMTEQQI